ncbi:uncharacterized protein [Ptychodera flava]
MDGNARLVEYLQGFYKRQFEFKALSWQERPLSQMYVPAQVTEVDKSGEGQTISNPVLTSSDVFRKLTNGNEARRIMVEGEAAVGVTSFCQKLAYDWAIGKLKKFYLVFFLEMKHLQQTSIIDAIFSKLLTDGVGISKEELWRYVIGNPDSILFIFDDVDIIYNDTSDNDVIRILTNRLLPSSTVLMTSKPSQHRSKIMNFESKFIITGLSYESCQMYIDRYFRDNKELGDTIKSSLKDEEAMSYLLHPSAKSLRSLSSQYIPLHLSFLCLLWEDLQDYFPRRSAELYSAILLSVYKRHNINRGHESFIDEKINRQLKDETRELARVAFNNLKEGRLHFDVNTVNKFPGWLRHSDLLRNTILPATGQQENASFYHKSWLEYFAAVHASERLKSPDVAVMSEFGFLFDDLKGNFQVLLFLVGLLGNKAGHVFRGIGSQALKAWGHDNSSQRMENCLHLLFECKYYNSEIISHISPHMTQVVCLRQKPSISSVVSLHQDRLYDCKTSPRVVKVSVLDQGRLFPAVMDLLKHQCTFSRHYPITVKIEHLLLGFRSRREVLSFSKALENDEISLRSLTFDLKSVTEIGASDCLVVALRETSSLNEIVLKSDVDSPVLTDLVHNACQNKEITGISVDSVQSRYFTSIPFETLECNGPDELSIQCDSCDLDEAVMTKVWRLLRRCRKTRKIKYKFHAMKNSNTPDKIDRLKDSLKHPSRTVTSLTLALPRAPDAKVATCDVINDVLHILASNATLEELEIGLEPSNIPKLCDLITHNGKLKSIICCLDMNGSNSIPTNTFNLLTKALQKNHSLASFTVRTACRNRDVQSQTVSDEDLLNALVAGLLLPVSDWIEKGKIMLTTFTCVVRCENNVRFDLVFSKLAANLRCIRWSYKVFEFDVSENAHTTKPLSTYYHQISLTVSQQTRSRACEIQ